VLYKKPYLPFIGKAQHSKNGCDKLFKTEKKTYFRQTLIHFHNVIATE